jgi:ABC-type phosphate transport system ATPase subunit
MNDLIPTARVEGTLVPRRRLEVGLRRRVRRRIGMVFQRLNPFPRASTTTSPSVEDQRVRKKGEPDDIVERSLRQTRSGTR